jgi:hypothetical protein
MGLRWVGDNRHFIFRQKMLGEDGSVRRGVVMVKLWHGSCPILSSEPVGMSHNQFAPLQQCREWSDVDPDRQALEFMQQFQELCSLWVSLRVRHRQLMCDRSLTGHAIATPAYDSKIWSPKACWIIMWVSVAIFPSLAKNLMHTPCSFIRLA